MGKWKKVFVILGITLAVTMTAKTNVYAEQPAPGQESVQPAQPEQPAQPAQPEQPAAPAAGQAATDQAAQQQQQAAQQAGQAATQAATQAPAAKKTTAKTTTKKTTTEEKPEEPVETGPKTEDGKYILSFIKNANLRSEASTTGKSLLVVPAGIKLSGTSKTTNEAGEVWYKLNYAGSTGYVREDMVNVEAATENAEDGDVNEAAEGDGAEQENEGGEESLAENTDNQEQSANTTPVTTETKATDEKSSEVTEGITNAQNMDSLTDVKGDAETTTTRKLDGYMLLFITCATVSFCLACYIFLRIRVEYKKARAYVIKKLMKDKHSIKVQGND